MKRSKLKEVLKLHLKWLADEEGGERADLRWAKLTYVDLEGANLTRADLRGATLAGANLTRADLREAKLANADAFSFQIPPRRSKKACIISHYSGERRQTARLRGLISSERPQA